MPSPNIVSLTVTPPPPRNLKVVPRFPALGGWNLAQGYNNKENLKAVETVLRNCPFLMFLINKVSI